MPAFLAAVIKIEFQRLIAELAQLALSRGTSFKFRHWHTREDAPNAGCTIRKLEAI